MNERIQSQGDVPSRGKLPPTPWAFLAVCLALGLALMFLGASLKEAGWEKTGLPFVIN
jgi:hypothetical protein